MYDLIGAIRQVQQTIPIKCAFEYVRGHQDLGIKMVLNQTAWMNIEMDLLAKAMIQSHFTGPQKYQLDREPWICYIKGQQQIKNVSTALCQHINMITIKAHWIKK